LPIEVYCPRGHLIFSAETEAVYRIMRNSTRTCKVCGIKVDFKSFTISVLKHIRR